VDFEITRDEIEMATTASIQHIEERGKEYVADWAPLDGPFSKSFDAVYQSNKPNGGTLGANRNSGIYLILENGTRQAYVGLAKNFSDRFFNGNPSHPRGCQNCRCHGHITVTPDSCTSHTIINSRRGYSVYILSEIPYRGDQISQAEIEWYHILEKCGYEMVNAVWALGKKGYVGRSIISLNIATDKYHFFPTITEATRTLFGTGANPGWVNQTLSNNRIAPQSNHVRGYINRYATRSETVGYTGSEMRQEDLRNLISASGRDVMWTRGRDGPSVDLGTECAGCSNPSVKHNKRKFRIIWISGALLLQEVQHLHGTMQGKYIPSDWPKKKGVSKLQSRVDPTFIPRYQVRWKSRIKPKRPHQTNKPEWTKRRLIDAVLWRENKIIDENLQSYNSGTYGSNAKWINFRQPWRFVIRNYFTDWEDGDTGLSRVLTIYGMLSLVSLTLLLLIL